jgi:hypothetical protein
MCGSLIDSLSAGIIICGTGLIFILSQKPEYIWLGSLICAIGAMQFIDAILWIQKEQNISTDFVSHYVTILILILQPIVSYLGYVYFYKKRMPLFEAILVPYVICSVYVWSITCKDTTITSDGYLKWCDFNMLSVTKLGYILIVIFPMLFFPNMLQRVLFLLAITGTWIYNYNHEAFGSRWCYSTILYAVLALGAFLIKE